MPHPGNGGPKESDVISPAKPDDVAALPQTHLAAEANAGFPVLSLCPSSDIIRFLDYFATLRESDRNALLHAHARVAAGTFFLTVPGVLDQVRELATSDPALLRGRAAMQSALYTMGLRHGALRMTKQCLNDAMTMAMMAETRARLDFTPRDDPPPVLVPDPDFTRIFPAKAPLLRKLIDPAFKQMFASGKTKRPGGETVHSGIFEGTAINVAIDYATRFY